MNYDSKIETSEVLELVNSTLYNLDLIESFISIFEEFIKDTIKQNLRENLHCNNFKVTLEIVDQVVSLPMHTELDDNQINFITDTIESFL